MKSVSHCPYSVTGIIFVLAVSFMAYCFPVQASRSAIVHLKIPSVGINTVLEDVGLTSDGDVDVPSEPANAAWFKLSPRPGQTGNSIIDGHFGWKDGIPAVFDRLNKVRLGDKIYVEDGAGVVTTFIVRQLKIYCRNEDASKVFYSYDGMAHLNLITCEGVWDKTTKSYSGRFVVFADLVVMPRSS